MFSSQRIRWNNMLWDMVVMWKLSQGEGFVLQMNDTLLLAVNSFLQSWIYIQGHWGSWLLQLYAVNTVDSISYRRWGPYMNWCSLTCVQPWIPFWFSPTSSDPCLLHHQILGSVLIRLPRCCLHSSPSCLHSSPTCSSPSQTPPPTPTPTLPHPHSQSSFRSSHKQAGFLAICPLQTFQLSVFQERYVIAKHRKLRLKKQRCRWWTLEPHLPGPPHSSGKATGGALNRSAHVSSSVQ